jgi:hypothetical protein
MLGRRDTSKLRSLVTRGVFRAIHDTELALVRGRSNQSSMWVCRVCSLCIAGAPVPGCLWCILRQHDVMARRRARCGFRDWKVHGQSKEYLRCPPDP